MPPRSLFPPAPVDEARVLAQTIAESNAGQPMRRIDVFDVLQRSAESGPSRNLVTASFGFGLTTGGYQAEFLSLTDLGRRLAVDGDESAAIEAVLHVDVFRQFFETYANSQLPSEVAARSFLAGNGVPADRTLACLDLILQNGRHVGLIAQRSGAEYVLIRQHAVEERQRAGGPSAGAIASAGSRGTMLQLPAPPPLSGTSEVRALHLTVEIHLPSDQTPEVYDKIFESMRRHLIEGHPPGGEQQQ